jgi:hypothetical protein
MAVKYYIHLGCPHPQAPGSKKRQAISTWPHFHPYSSPFAIDGQRVVSWGKKIKNRMATAAYSKFAIIVYGHDPSVHH